MLAGMHPIADLLALQSGVVSRRQALERGLGDHDLRRLVRRRELTVVHPGVLVDHTGPLLWAQRAWAATLSVAPSALSGTSALRAVNGPGRRDHDDRAPIHVAVDRQRKVVSPAGVVVHRVAGLEDRVLWNTSPPRLRTEEAVIDLAADARSELDAVHRIADAVQSRSTTADRLRAALDSRARVPRRSFLADVLDDIDQGACSVLEHGYLTRVERPHGLQRADRQVRDSARGPVYRDVDYREHGLVVELDGRLFHDSARARDRDLDRDLEVVVSGRRSVRLGWGQVFDRPCRTASHVAALLRAGGWTGCPIMCPDCPPRSIAAVG